MRVVGTLYSIEMPKWGEQGSLNREDQTRSRCYFCFSVVYVYRSRIATTFTIYYNALPSGQLAKTHKNAAECNYKQVIAGENENSYYISTHSKHGTLFLSLQLNYFISSLRFLSHCRRISTITHHAWYHLRLPKCFYKFLCVWK